MNKIFFLYNIYLSVKRSSFFNKKLITLILYVVWAIFFIAQLLLVFLNFDIILEKINPNLSLIDFIRFALLYALMIDLLIHLIFGKHLHISVKYYLILNIDKKRIIKFLLFADKFKLVNIILLSFIVPVSLKFMWQDFHLQTLVFILNIVLIVFVNDMISLLITINDYAVQIKSIFAIVLISIMILFKEKIIELSKGLFPYLLDYSSITLLLFILYFLLEKMSLKRLKNKLYEL